MEYVKIAFSDSEKWNAVWQLYESSFPEVERRRFDDHLRAMNDSNFVPLSVWEKTEFVGLLFYWECDSIIYVEHLAVDPAKRSGGYGSKILSWLKEKNKTLILEIEPLTDELSVRRWKFYQKEKFHLSPYVFLQLPYRKNPARVPLLILSFPEMIGDQQYERFTNFMQVQVMPYCEK